MRQLIYIVLFMAGTCTIACTKPETKTPVNTIRGSWKYVGYSGGFAGLPFTPQDSIVYFLQFDETRYTSVKNNTQGCGTYAFIKDTAAKAPYIGLLQLSGESYPDKFDAYLSNDTLTLYPHGFADAFSYSFVYSLKQFDWCDTTAENK